MVDTGLLVNIDVRKTAGGWAAVDRFQAAVPSSLQDGYLIWAGTSHLVAGSFPGVPSGRLGGGEQGRITASV